MNCSKNTLHSVAAMARSPRRRLTRGDGFSLIEVLIAAALVLVILVAIYTVWFGLQRTYSFTDEDLAAQEQARAALTEMVASIRTARQPSSPPSEDVNLVIVSAESNSLICWTDIDHNPGTGLDGLELIRFRVNVPTRTLYRDTISTAPWDVTFASAEAVRLVSNWVSNNPAATPPTPLFTYRDGNGGSPSDVTQIREIVIDLRIDVYTDEAPISHRLNSVVQPRNLRQY